MKRRSFDVFIVGGGAMGLSTAYHLTRCNVGKKNPLIRVGVAEKDSSMAHASTLLSAGGIRQQFSNKENILLSQNSLQFLRGRCADTPFTAANEAQLQERGYLMLAGSTEGAAVLRENTELQQSLGAGTELLSPEEIQQAFPYMSVDGVSLGAYGTRDEGWFDPALFHNQLKEGCKAQGVEFLENTEVRGLRMEATRAVAADVASGSDGGEVVFGQLVNAAGCASARVAAMMGWPTHPVEPRKRYTFWTQTPALANGADGCFHEDYPPSAEAPLVRPMPLVVDPSGAWVRPLSNGFICGAPQAEDPAADPADFDVKDDSEELLMDAVWPVLATRIQAFETMKVASRWVGHYEYNTADQNGIIGQHPSCSNGVHINGFSGHGIQQSPAAGRAVAELITHGSFQSLDLSAMSPKRFDAGELIFEKNVV